jgi:hypothetical protein
MQRPAKSEAIDSGGKQLRHATRNTEHATRNTQQETRNRKHATRNGQVCNSVQHRPTHATHVVEQICIKTDGQNMRAITPHPMGG